ncbi:hypothetical protein OV079_23880 [Nannocystis pusilla]|uniref:Uncharacterized protein n=1 Tax=Nannocystis pusilla TaxID=889268 RepID=A0A9X3ER08_9BACT|nr:hypothetical protein [Nannocystis pusilla]MCY1004019.1 hypothetical protein [Nannocystis pusilla]MCY1008543.1 hypothetical protein [Nannocystis pusilla]
MFEFFMELCITVGGAFFAEELLFEVWKWATRPRRRGYVQRDRG